MFKIFSQIDLSDIYHINVFVSTSKFLTNTVFTAIFKLGKININNKNGLGDHLKIK